MDEKGKPGTNSNTKLTEGDFDVIYDESIILSKKKSNYLKKVLKTPLLWEIL